MGANALGANVIEEAFNSRDVVECKVWTEWLEQVTFSLKLFEFICMAYIPFGRGAFVSVSPGWYLGLTWALLVAMRPGAQSRERGCNVLCSARP